MIGLARLCCATVHGPPRAQHSDSGILLAVAATASHTVASSSWSTTRVATSRRTPGGPWPSSRLARRTGTQAMMSAALAAADMQLMPAWILRRGLGERSSWDRQSSSQQPSRLSGSRAGLARPASFRRLQQVQGGPMPAACNPTRCRRAVTVRHCIGFYFILFYFILFYFILFYFIFVTWLRLVWEDCTLQCSVPGAHYGIGW
jgi:hypothetical protein